MVKAIVAVIQLSEQGPLFRKVFIVKHSPFSTQAKDGADKNMTKTIDMVFIVFLWNKNLIC